MNRRELARRSGLNINTVCKWANGNVTMIDMLTLNTICQTLHIQLSEVLRWESDKDA